MVTDRDRSVVCWIAAIGAAQAQDVMARFGMGRTVAYRRLGELVARPVVRAVRFSVAQPGFYVATREGLTWARLEDVDPGAGRPRSLVGSVPRRDVLAGRRADLLVAEGGEQVG